MNYSIYPNVKLGQNVQIADFVVIGVPPKGRNEGELETIIGDNVVLRSHTVIYAGTTLGNDVETGHGALIRENSVIADDVSIGSHSVIEHHVRIASGVRIHSLTFIPEYSTLEQECWIGPNVTFTNVLHPTCTKAKECIKGPTIKRRAVVGAGANILPDITVGEGALVGAGAVVVSHVPDFKVVAGNPAKVTKDVSDLTCPYSLIDHPYEVPIVDHPTG